MCSSLLSGRCQDSKLSGVKPPSCFTGSQLTAETEEMTYCCLQGASADESQGTQEGPHVQAQRLCWKRLGQRAPGTFSWKEHGLWRHRQLICIQIRQEKYSAKMRDGTKKNAGLSLKLTRRIASEEALQSTLRIESSTFLCSCRESVVSKKGVVVPHKV
ncbi:unnamed protein product [Eretmochelys imbricata]